MISDHSSSPTPSPKAIRNIQSTTRIPTSNPIQDHKSQIGGDIKATTQTAQKNKTIKRINTEITLLTETNYDDGLNYHKTIETHSLSKSTTTTAKRKNKTIIPINVDFNNTHDCKVSQVLKIFMNIWKQQRQQFQKQVQIINNRDSYDMVTAAIFQKPDNRSKRANRYRYQKEDRPTFPRSNKGLEDRICCYPSLLGGNHINFQFMKQYSTTTNQRSVSKQYSTTKQTKESTPQHKTNSKDYLDNKLGSSTTTTTTVVKVYRNNNSKNNFNKHFKIDYFKLEKQNQETITTKTEDKSKEELITTVYDLEYCITSLEEQNSRLTSEASIFKEKSENNEKKVNEITLTLLTERRIKEEYEARNQAIDNGNDGNDQDRGIKVLYKNKPGMQGYDLNLLKDNKDNNSNISTLMKLVSILFKFKFPNFKFRLVSLLIINLDKFMSFDFDSSKIFVKPLTSNEDKEFMYAFDLDFGVIN
ncbi:hypothetical protein ACTA71_009658 [Dictyostelium dimigraforme]